MPDTFILELFASSRPSSREADAQLSYRWLDADGTPISLLPPILSRDDVLQVVLNAEPIESGERWALIVIESETPAELRLCYETPAPVEPSEGAFAGTWKGSRCVFPPYRVVAREAPFSRFGIELAAVPVGSLEPTTFYLDPEMIVGIGNGGGLVGESLQLVSLHRLCS
ncbi:MAG: hypothetical protein AAGC60_21470 [Acidobacteriota bacterium]